MTTGYLMKWIERERGWGVRPDGYSLHLTEGDYDDYLEAYWEAMPVDAPDEYSAPEEKHVVPVEVDSDLYEKLSRERSMRFYEGELILAVEHTGRRKVRIR